MGWKMVKTGSFRTLLLSGACALLMSSAALAQDRSFNIPAGDLKAALEAFAQQAGIELVYKSSDVVGRRTKGVAGSLDAREALARLLDGTSLTMKDRQGAILVSTGASAPSAPAAPDKAAESKDAPQEKSSDNTADADRNVERVVVTGTHIRGKHPQSSPLETYTKKDIERSGATTTEQFIQKLPQNSARRSTYASAAFGSGADNNAESVASVDLRGLGGGTTLVLLNGRRLGLSDTGRTVDISLIPVSAIERVEVLTDGASAIYGSDAVGGVVNFVLRKDFDGAETSLSYGGVTSGNLRQGEFSQTFGRAWGSGHGLVAFSAYSASGLDVTDRSYSAGMELGKLTPIEQRQNVLITFSQDITDRLTASADIALAARDVKSSNTNPVNSTNPLDWTYGTSAAETEQYFANFSLDYEFSDNLTGTFTSTFSETDTQTDFTSTYYRRTPPAFNTSFQQDKNYSVLDLTGMLSGELFALPGGDVRFSVGGGYLDEEYSGAALLFLATAARPTRTLARSTTYAFGELFIPLIGAEQDIPLVHRLELSVAARYTRYDDHSTPALEQSFGDATDPKIGLLWAPSDSFNLRGTYGTSFRAPSLSQLDESTAINVLSNTVIPRPSGPSVPRLAVNFSTRAGLGPETAETYTLGFDVHPQEPAGLRISGTYYNISYTDRIAQPPSGGTAYLTTPSLFPDVIFRAPSADFIEQILRSSTNTTNTLGINLSDPHAAAATLFANPALWIVDFRFRNLSLSEQDGFDLGVSHNFDTEWGEVFYGANVTRILSYLQQTSPASVVVSVTDTALQPVDLRGRLYAGISHGGFDGTLGLNYIDDYTNTIDNARPNVESWITVDLSLSYEFDDDAADALRGARLSLSVQNMFDEDPPFLSGGSASTAFNPIGFDPANANPLGRLVVFGLTKRW